MNRIQNIIKMSEILSTQQQSVQSTVSTRCSKNYDEHELAQSKKVIQFFQCFARESIASGDKGTINVIQTFLNRCDRYGYLTALFEFIVYLDFKDSPIGTTLASFIDIDVSDDEMNFFKRVQKVLLSRIEYMQRLQIKFIDLINVKHNLSKAFFYILGCKELMDLKMDESGRQTVLQKCLSIHKETEKQRNECMKLVELMIQQMGYSISTSEEFIDVVKYLYTNRMENLAFFVMKAFRIANTSFIFDSWFFSGILFASFQNRFQYLQYEYFQLDQFQKDREIINQYSYEPWMTEDRVNMYIAVFNLGQMLYMTQQDLLKKCRIIG